jgi:hypothetical protein
VCTPDIFPTGYVSDEEPRTHNVFQRKTRFPEDTGHFVKDETSLPINVTFGYNAIVVGSNGSSHLDVVANLHGPGIANNVFPFGTRRIVYAFHDL